MKNSPKFISGRGLGTHCFGSVSGFTLIELMAVVLVILLLVAISLGVSSFVKQRLANTVVKSQIATLEAALESYKSDWGYYPVTGPERLSHDGFKESTNNWCLYKALTGSGGGRKYISPTAMAAQTNQQTLLLNLFDRWGSPYIYYNSPNTGYAVSNSPPAGWPVGVTFYGGYTVGGQMNPTSYDLFSYGPDRLTYVPCISCYPPGLIYAWWYIGRDYGWTNKASALDDITR